MSLNVACKREEGTENPQRFYALKMEQTPFILMCNDAVSKIVNLLGVRRDLELRNVQGTARRPRGSPLWCLACLGAAVTHVSFIRCGVTASCPLRVEELKGTDIYIYLCIYIYI